MASNAAIPSLVYDSIEVLVFSIQGTMLAIDGEQVDRLLTLEEAERDKLNLEWFHRKFAFAESAVDYKHPRVITMTGTGNQIGLVIEQPHDFMTVPINTIRPLPILFTQRKGLKPFWGAYMNDNEIVLLVDFYELLG